MPTRTKNLSLIDNSHSFMREAAAKAVAAQDDIHQWNFAIINLVQAVELSLKELLRRVHPVLVFEDIDAPRHTVSIGKALARIENHQILGISLSSEEKRKINKAIDLRNEIVHSEFEFRAEYAMAKFSELFSFISYFQARFLEIEMEDVIPTDLLRSVAEIRKCFLELRKKAEQRIVDEKIPDELVWVCPLCEEDTLVINDNRGVCYLCRDSGEIYECGCGKSWYEHEVKSFSDLIEVDEGEVLAPGEYSYVELAGCCSGCISEIREEIERKRTEEMYELMEEEWYSSTQR